MFIIIYVSCFPAGFRSRWAAAGARGTYCWGDSSYFARGWFVEKEYRITATWRNGCFEKMAVHSVHTIPNHRPTKMDVLPKTFVQIILAAKWFARHSRMSRNQQRRPLPSLLYLSYFYMQDSDLSEQQPEPGGPAATPTGGQPVIQPLPGDTDHHNQQTGFTSQAGPTWSLLLYIVWKSKGWASLWFLYEIIGGGHHHCIDTVLSEILY